MLNGIELLYGGVMRLRYKTMKFEDNLLKLLDQRKLPEVTEIYAARTYQDVILAISNMVVRGAPAIGAAAAYGFYLAALQFKDRDKEDFLKAISSADKKLAAARPSS